MPVFKIHHITKYQYDRSVTESVNEIRIYPYQSEDQELLKHDISITHNPSVHLFTDYWGNRAGIFNIIESHKELVIESKLVIRTIVPINKTTTSRIDLNFLHKEVAQNLQLIEYTKPDQIENFETIDVIIKNLLSKNQPIESLIMEASQYVFMNFTYTKGITTIETTIDEILTYKQGVCQDFAHLLLQILRSMGIPCRYVSGYICPNKDGMRGEGATHAWVEIWIPAIGWKGIDPTNNVWVEGNHVKLAVGRNFYDCSIVKGSFKGGARQDLYVFVSVGYEDGHIFEDTNRVQLDKQKIDTEDEISFMNSQQQ